jgi:ABC-type amino acid transport substrate-binding protein
MKRILLAGAVAAVLTLTGCGLTIPTDPDGTLESVRGGTLRVGASPNGELVIADDSNSVSGSEAELIETFADTLDANIEWTVASEETLVRGLENDELDVVIAGMTDATPWVDMAGVTRPYREVTASDGSTHKLVMLVPMGENAFITELETFLSESGEASE